MSEGSRFPERFLSDDEDVRNDPDFIRFATNIEKDLLADLESGAMERHTNDLFDALNRAMGVK